MNSLGLPRLGASYFSELLPRDILRPILAVAAIVAAFAFVFCFVVVARADDGAAVQAPPASLLDIWNIISPLAITFATIFGPIAGSWIVMQVIGLLKIQDQQQQLAVEGQLRDALHQAAINGLKYAFTKAGLPATAFPPASVVADAVNYVQSKNPDAVAKLNVDPDTLQHIVLAKAADVHAYLGQWMATAATETATPPAPASSAAAVAPAPVTQSVASAT